MLQGILKSVKDNRIRVAAPGLTYQFDISAATIDAGPQGLRADVDARAWGAVVPFAHTLKGRAGLLGMSEIAAIAGRLEAAARAGDAARAQRALQALEAGLRPIVEGLDRVLPRRGEGSV